MDWKEFFKPTLWKILTFITLFIILTIFVNPLILLPSVDHASMIYGFPILIVEKWHTMGPSGVIEGINFSWIGLIFNIIIWYIISCLIFIKKSLK
jgi:hypothetical protein